jgi:hypothetical protein
VGLNLLWDTITEEEATHQQAAQVGLNVLWDGSSYSYPSRLQSGVAGTRR